MEAAGPLPPGTGDRPALKAPVRLLYPDVEVPVVDADPAAGSGTMASIGFAYFAGSARNAACDASLEKKYGRPSKSSRGDAAVGWKRSCVTGSVRRPHDASGSFANWSRSSVVEKK